MSHGQQPRLSHNALQSNNTSPSQYLASSPLSIPLRSVPGQGGSAVTLGKTSRPQEWLCHHCRHPIWTTHMYREWERSVRSVLARARRMRRRPGTRWPRTPAEDPVHETPTEHFLKIWKCTPGWYVTICWWHAPSRTTNKNSEMSSVWWWHCPRALLLSD